jgi:hypothetical protein
MKWKRHTAALAIALFLAGTGIAVAGPASAAPGAPATLDGWCDQGEACLYYNSNLEGAIFDVPYNVPSFAFAGPNRKLPEFTWSRGGTGDINAGAGQRVWNNAASVRNKSRCFLRIYYNSNYDGRVDAQEIAPGQWANLDPVLKNNNASMKFEC